MKIFFQILKSILVFGLLTLLTQVGGIVYLVYKSIFQKIKTPHTTILSKVGLFAMLYLLTTLLLVPFVAPYFGRQPLNWFAKKNKPIAAHTYLTCLLNRHYVTPKLYTETQAIAVAINKKHPEVQVKYFDANFPFWDGYPLWPHLSHSDGKKLDIAFIYKSPKGNTLKKGAGLLGYGICEEPRPNEINQSKICAQKGYWQYSILKKITPQFNKKKYLFDEQKTKDLLLVIVNRKGIKKVLLEPHLKNRLGLQQNGKIRFHGCHAVRHDDHIHLQL